MHIKIHGFLTTGCLVLGLCGAGAAAERPDATAWPQAMLAARERACPAISAPGTNNIPGAARAEVKALDPDRLASFEALAGVSWGDWLAATNTAPEARATEQLLEALVEPARAEWAARRVRAGSDRAALLAVFDGAYEQALTAQATRLPRLAFVRRKAYGLRHTNATMFAIGTDQGAAIMVYDPAHPDDPPRTIFETTTGFIWDISPSWDGRKLLMSYKERIDLPFHVWEIGTDGTGLRQLTRGPYHDFNPVYYPDGRIVFASSRVESYSLCQDFLASALHICDPDGGNLRRIDFTSLCTMAPAVLPDGSILCTRWEYQDKNIFQWEGLWTIHPDGRQLKLYYGNTLSVPNARYGGKPVPGSSTVLITMAGHHLPPIADVAVVDRSQGLENPEGMRKVTFETPYEVTGIRHWRDARWGPGDAFYPQAVTDPWPLRNPWFLASIGNDARPAAGFRLCLCRYDGLRFPVWRTEGAGAFSAVTLAPREPPRAVFGGQCPQEPGEGTFFVQDVYQGLLQQGVKRGMVKALRVVRPTPKKWNTEGPRFHDHYPVVGYGSYYIKENLGEVPVDANGSAYFKAPSNCELYFIALDQDGREIQRMGSVTQITSGEQVSCVGCHEDRLQAPPVSLRNAARLARPPDTLRPPPWGAGPFDYVRHVQPVWDRHCVRCHSGRAPAAGLDLSGDKTRFFNMSFDHLMARNLVEYYFINPGPTGVFPALGSGSWVSKLSALIAAPHHDVRLNDEERRRVYTWIDSNAQYYSTWDMARPHTMGGRDPWHFVPDNRRVPPQPEPWFAEFTGVFAKHCAACHEDFAMGNRNNGQRGVLYPRNRWLNLTRPEYSLVLNAHLSRAAGGLGVVGAKGDPAPPVFRDTHDPVYQSLLKALERGRDALAARPRMDMPGGVAVPQERDFGKVF